MNLKSGCDVDVFLQFNHVKLHGLNEFVLCCSSLFSTTGCALVPHKRHSWSEFLCVFFFSARCFSFTDADEDRQAMAEGEQLMLKTK